MRAMEIAHKWSIRKLKIENCHAGLLFDAVVGFDGFGLDDDGRVTALNVLRGRGYGTRHVTGGEDETRRYHDEQATN